MNRLRLVAILSLALVVGTGLYAWWQFASAESGVWRFNFAPANAPAVASFYPVDSGSDYQAELGFGWLAAEGPVVEGQWPSRGAGYWEARENFNVLTRPAPDDLARSFASGGANFALDLEPGVYEVWVLSGDTGYLEYTPRQAYSIEVEGSELHSYAQKTEEAYAQAYQTPMQTDDLDEEGAWQRYIAPHIQWHKTRVEVTDGQLNIKLLGAERSAAGLHLAGSYPYTEGGRGPKRRYAGALNALVVFASAENAMDSAVEMQRIEAWRRQDFAASWPMLRSDKMAAVVGASDDDDRGYSAKLLDPMVTILPATQIAHTETPFKARVAPGGQLVLSMGLQTMRDLGEARVDLGTLQGVNGEVQLEALPGSGVVRYTAQRVAGEEGGWRATPSEIVPLQGWQLAGGVSKQLWLRYRVPAATAAGHYRGYLNVAAELGRVSTLAVDIEVLPFTLPRPADLSLGMTYFSPVQDAWYDEAQFWRRLESEFRDMHRQGFTTVQYTGIGLDDKPRLDRLMRLYQSIGFERPLVLLECYGAMDRLRREGLAWGSEAFFNRYQSIVQQLVSEARRRHWPALVVNFGDEFTNSGLEEFGAQVATRLARIPGITTGVDANGAREIELLAPLVDIVAFNNGWAGPNRVNDKRPLLNKGTVATIAEAGAEPWLVNVGTDRFSNGYWLWKMVGLGVRGKLEWIYRSFGGMPHNPFDGAPLRQQLVLPAANNQVLHTLAFARMGLGLEDLAYLQALEQALDRAQQVAPGERAVAAASHFLKQLGASLDDDYNRYLNGKTAVWQPRQFADTREAVIEHILQLQAIAGVVAPANAVLEGL